MASQSKLLRKKLRPLRVRQSKEQIAEATGLATAALADRVPRQEVLAQVTKVVKSVDVAEAIVSFVESERRLKPKFAKSESISGSLFFLTGLAVIWACERMAHWLLAWVAAMPEDPKAAIVAACGQAILIRLAWHVFKTACIGLTDSLNKATYPTALHQPTVTNRIEDGVRYERLRLLIAEMVIRIGKGEKLASLYRELTRIELTRSAAVCLLSQAWTGFLIKSNLPPYASRSRAYVIASAAAAGCGLALYLVHENLRSIAQVAYLLTWSVLIVVEFLKRRRGIAEYENG